MHTNKFLIGGLIGVHVSSIVNEVAKTILSQFIFLYGKILNAQKRKSKSTNKIKLSKQKATKATIFCAQKLLRGRKLVILRFLKKLKLS